MKVYERKIDNGKGCQQIGVLDKVFVEHRKFALYGGYYEEGVPNGFEIGKKVPFGFFAKSGFKQIRGSTGEEFFSFKDDLVSNCRDPFTF